MFLKRFALLSFPILLFFALLSGSVSAVEPIKVGLLSPFPNENPGEEINPYLWGAEIAVAEINAREGKGRIQFLLIIARGKYDREKDLRELRELVIG